MSDILSLFAKAPRPGKAKTRLAATVGHERALAIYRELVSVTCAALDEGPAGRRIAFYAPQDGEDEVRRMCERDWDYLPQSGDDLGARMETAFRQGLATGERMLLVGTDCPTLTGELLTRALAALDSADLVLGPSEDGGYYLIGMPREGLARRVPAIFDGVAWSTSDVLAQTLARAGDPPPALLEAHNDVDTEADYLAWRGA